MSAPKNKLILSLCLALGIVAVTFYLLSHHAKTDLRAPVEEEIAKSLPVDKAAQLTVIRANFGRTSLTFEENRGQADAPVKFVARSLGGTFLLSPTETKVAFSKNSAAKKSSAKNAGYTAQNEFWQMKLLGANHRATSRGIEPLASKSNYLIGSDQKNWQTDVSQFAKAEFAEVYAGVDLVYYGSQEKLEYDFIVKPSAQPDQIRVAFDDAVSLETNGDLLIQTKAGALTQKKPFAYQEINGVRQEIACQFKILKDEQNHHSTIGFEIGEYDKNQTLIIDPMLIYTTYLGGSGGGLFDAEQGTKIVADAAGNAYIAGLTPSPDFPTRNPLQANAGGGTDCFVAKLNPDGSNLIYSTFLGGNQSDICTGLDIDAAGNIYVTGQTFSDNFPLVNPFQTVNKGNGDAFVAKLNPAGSALVFSTFLGGASSELTSSVKLDASGNIYVGGSTSSGDFPTLNPVQATLRGGLDSFVTKFNPAGSALIFSTYFGGDVDDFAAGPAVDAAGNSYMAGTTSSRNFPVTVGAFQTIKSGSDDAFIFKLNAAGSVGYSTYLGGSGIDNAGDIAVDLRGNAITTGFTRSLNFPRKNAFQTRKAGTVDSFVTKLSSDGKSLVFSTYLGGGELQRGFGVATDNNGNVYASGRTNSGDFPLKKPLQDFAGLDDIYVAKFTPEGALVFSTPLGGDTNDLGTRIAADGSGNVYVTGFADFGLRTTAGAFQPNLAGGVDAFVSKINTNTRTVKSDFDGDRKSDIAVFRPSDGTWYILNSSNGGFSGVQFGASGDRPVPGDYDGDGKTDVAVYRPSTGIWYWLRSSDNNVVAIAWGSEGDRPVQGDYDNDGVTDVAVYRPALGSWLILQSSENALRVQQLGVAEDKPVQADYDGDEATDVAVFHPSNGVWYVLQSFVGVKTQQFGLSNDLLVPSDYDGDGKDDIAVFRPNGGFWYVSRSTDNGFFSAQFGLSTDVPVPGDFDGDRQTDLAVYRGGNWYIRQSSDNQFRAVQFGLSDDIPILSTYLP
ncbi:MAG: SBBP repeat-containing protein [Pyrinomonadaceae bacterium]